VGINSTYTWASRWASIHGLNILQHWGCSSPPTPIEPMEAPQHFSSMSEEEEEERRRKKKKKEGGRKKKGK